MSTTNFQNAFDMSVLAEAAYYEGINNNADNLEGTQWDKPENGNINSNKGLFKYANSTWQVIYHVPNNDTGLQFYLVKNKETDAYTLAFSGTSVAGGNNPRQNFSDTLADAGNALGSIGDISSPFPIQLFDAINHIRKRSTPAGQTYQKLYWNPSSTANKNLIYSANSSEESTYIDELYIGQSDDVGLGLIPQGVDISLTGQSLGGFLVQALTLLDPANNIDKGYSFNGPGVSEKIVLILQIIKGSVLYPANIENWYGETGVEIITPPIAQQGVIYDVNSVDINLGDFNQAA